MKELYTRLHSEMLVEIDRHMQQPRPEKVKAETCYFVTRNYWEKLKGPLSQYTFNDENEEMSFFLNDKPRFVCHFEYFHLIKEALANLPLKRMKPFHFGYMKKGD